MELDPAQQEIIALLGRSPDRPELPADLGEQLSTALTEQLAPLAVLMGEESAMSGNSIFINKRLLANLHTCEAMAIAEKHGDFAWSVPTARGTVAHKAVELLVNWRGPADPSTVVDAALVRLVDDPRADLANFLGGLGEGEHAELRGQVVAWVTQFMECFPPLKPQWFPTVEANTKATFLQGRIVLGGRTDLTLGRPGEKVIIDLKTGSPHASHRDDLRFYGLVDTLKLKRAPRKLASYYLDTARAHAEDVTEGVLWSSVARTVDGVSRFVRIERGGEEPTRRPGSQCRWCPLADTCEAARQYEAQREEQDDRW
jgi:hypothetical protein